jgi:hypothetical protein
VSQVIKNGNGTWWKSSCTTRQFQSNSQFTSVQPSVEAQQPGRGRFLRPRQDGEGFEADEDD